MGALVPIMVGWSGARTLIQFTARSIVYRLLFGLVCQISGFDFLLPPTKSTNFQGLQGKRDRLIFALIVGAKCPKESSKWGQPASGGGGKAHDYDKLRLDPL